MAFPGGAGSGAERFPTGVYETTSRGAIISVTFDSYGKYTVVRNGEFAIRGSYVLSGEEIQLTDERGPRAGTGDRKSGIYRWHIDGDTLTLTLIQDLSPGRKRAFAQPWTRQI